ncbi:MAG: molybdopterin molybdenumtransferase MoeA [Alphaproteobacteria bacterium PA2]|nr:MAG: molybdopterin molybdenumtransferase MoeA [Alphaproteobacteria bacterium PA2]
MKLMAVDDARAAMLAEIAPMGTEQVPLARAIGRVLAEPVDALRDQPPFANSAMDGWAVRAADTPGALTIIGESAAGHGFEGVLAAGQAVRIFTGAALPAGADAVVIQEDAVREGDQVTVPAAQVGDNIRQAGRDFKAGQTLLTPGVRIDPWRLSLCASAGRAEVTVHRPPRVAILSTGEEIVEAPAVPGPFQIYDSGSPALQAMVEAWGGEVTRLTGVRDRLEDVIAALKGADADLIVTVGGASVGDHDLVRTAAKALGLSLRVESIAVRPGKPTFFGVLEDGRRMLGLPGNPASAFVCAELFLRPIIEAFAGRDRTFTLRRFRLAEALPANGPREHWMRGRVDFSSDEPVAHLYGDQDSSLVTVFEAANVLVRRAPKAAALEPGDLVETLSLDRL